MTLGEFVSVCVDGRRQGAPGLGRSLGPTIVAEELM